MEVPYYPPVPKDKFAEYAIQLLTAGGIITSFYFIFQMWKSINKGIYGFIIEILIGIIASICLGLGKPSFI